MIEYRIDIVIHMQKQLVHTSPKMKKNVSNLIISASQSKDIEHVYSETGQKLKVNKTLHVNKLYKKLHRESLSSLN